MSNFIVDSDKKLLNLSHKLKSSLEIGLDTEFIRESTYRPILALVQISLEDGSIYLIDPLNINNKDILIDIMTDTKIIKIIHSAKQDIEALYNFTGHYPANIFDTQIASNFSNEQSNVSYSTLVKNICNVDIKSGSWRTNWLKRPLDEKKIQYAADDVRFLIDIKNKLKIKLESLKRDKWFYEEQINELNKKNIIINPDEAWEKINYPIYFEDLELEILKKLACWRENLAIKYNIPKKWILSDNQLIKIIIAKQKKINEITNDIKQPLNQDEYEYLMDILSNKRKITNKNLEPNRLTESKCFEILSYVSEEYKIDSTIIANKRDIEIFCLSNKHTKFMKGWRYEIFGKLVQ